MSIEEFKSALDRMSAAERAQIAGHLRLLRWSETPGLAERLTKAHEAIDAGRKVTQEQLEQWVAERRAKR